MDTILIQDLEVSTHIGVPDAERATAQMLKVSIWMKTDTKKAAVSDDVADTIDYAEVAMHIQELGKTERKTVERFAEDIAQMILNDFKPESVSVSIDKFILPDAQRIAITINRP
ncbi:MAG: dihydroneopterin aldolase [bacterium]|nr:dihydroneopterin aldolase [bacterium]MDA1293022.1 dihydroneopterin aldolase [bacterium]